ncbi:hypothetical protein [Acidithiobacillus sulfuriphilus]|uniref:Uncharacterized protein n=2 Tax=Acidithiobacillus sulfuriphilus TaxID=1867749 RepID=A0A3M8RQY2_9PROT|nr:hypothetical protein [Acidithiobacillus sulfuriphilus]RNF71049.1 hypothetical protein EC580_01710 [Acidithiobacillus sulfuriphilus]
MNNTIKTYSLRDAAEAFPTLHDFLGRAQIDMLADSCRSSEERQWFRAKAVEIAGIIATMPKSYETDGQGKDAVAHLHYFTTSWDWYITEKDTDHDGQGQRQAFIIRSRTRPA